MKESYGKMRGGEVNLLDYWGVLVGRRKLAGLIVGSTFLISVIVSLLMPKIYASTASLLPPRQEDSLGRGLASLAAGALGGSAIGLSGRQSPSDLWVGIVKSRNAGDAIVNRLNLKEHYGADTLGSARRTLSRNTRVVKSKEGIIFITIEDKNPEFAARLATAFVEELDRINKSLVMTAGKRMRVFVEERLIEARQNLGDAEDALRVFQEKNKAVKLGDQSRVIIGAIGRLKGQLMAKEVELKTLLSYATANNPKVEIIRTEMEGLKERLQELEDGGKGGANTSRKDIFIPTVKMPGLSLRYARLLRDAKVHETLVEFLTSQYEMARIQEAKDSPTVQVLDRAQAPEKKAKPRRTLIVLLSTLTAAFFAVFMCFFMDYIEDMKDRNRARSGGNFAEEAAEGS